LWAATILGKGLPSRGGDLWLKSQYISNLRFALYIIPQNAPFLFPRKEFTQGY
jgi:hypothetical protein